MPKCFHHESPSRPYGFVGKRYGVSLLQRIPEVTIGENSPTKGQWPQYVEANAFLGGDLSVIAYHISSVSPCLDVAFQNSLWKRVKHFSVKTLGYNLPNAIFEAITASAPPPAYITWHMSAACTIFWNRLCSTVFTLGVTS